MTRELNRFSKLAQRYGVGYSDGDNIFRQGDYGDAMYLLYSGEVEITREDGGEGTCLAQLGPGDLFGEMALIDNKPRSATATSTAETVLIPLNADFLRGNIHRDTSFIFQLIETLIMRIEQTSQMMADSKTDNSPDGGAIADDINIMPFLAMFRGFDEPDRYLTFTAGERIINEGDHGDLMFIVLEGRVGITVGDGEGKRTLTVLERGDFFGESALLTDMPRSASAEAVTQVTAIPFVRKDLVAGLLENPEASLLLVQILIIRLRKNLDLISS